jgi:hypothetical protein
MRMGEFGPALLLLAASVVWTGTALAWPRAGQPVAAVFPSDMSAEAAFRGAVAAGAEAVLGTGALHSIVVARSDDPSFIQNLYGHGAVIVLRAPVAGGCR